MKNKTIRKGITFLILLTFVFIAWKLTGVIAWSWLWVLAPLWLTAAIVFAILLIVLIGVVVGVLIKEVIVLVSHDMNAKAREKNNEAIIDAVAAEYDLKRDPGESNAELKRRIAIEKQKARRACNGMEE